MKKYENESDSSLVEKTLLGDGFAYEELVLRHERAVTGTAMKITKNRFSAEDAAQDAFVAAWMKLDGLRDSSRFFSFVCAIAKNCAIDLCRRYNCAVPDISLDLLAYADLDEQTRSAQEDQADYERLREEVELLGAETRLVVKAHYFEGLSVREIASKLGMPEGTVKWRLSEGRKMLRKGYGIVEKEYDENEALVRRVMRQVEELKLWRLKKDKAGFENDYRAALGAVEALEESEDKHHALADVLICGYWWIPGEKNDELMKRIKESAEKGRNEDAMTAVMENEEERYRGQELIDYMQKIQLPYLEKLGFVKAQAYVFFWMGREYLDADKEKAGECFEKAKSLLRPVDVYYAVSVAAFRILPRIRNEPDEICCASGSLLKKIDGSYYLWTEPGFMIGGGAGLFYHAGLFDRMLFDAALRVGETRVSSDGAASRTFVADRLTVDTPAGRFLNCRRYRTVIPETQWAGSIETDYAAGVGIVRQKTDFRFKDKRNAEWLLSDCRIKGGKGFLPFAIGNRWEYRKVETRDGYLQSADPAVYEVVGMSEDSVSVAGDYYHRNAYDLTGFAGNMLCASEGYFNNLTQQLVDVLPYFAKAKTLAGTRREKLQADVAYRVMHRILHTFPGFDPAYTEYGRWNFFHLSEIKRKDGGVVLLIKDNDYHFELKDMKNVGHNGYPVLHSFLYDMLSDATGDWLWNDEWIPGAHFERSLNLNGRADPLDVKIDIAPVLERVETPAGVFEDCLRLTFDLHGLKGGNAYRGGVKHYWFAPGVGIVQMKAPYRGEHISHWALTGYRGTGEGYFPCADGFSRRYEAQNLKGGWHGSVEYTFLEDEEGLTLFRDALGTQDRADYEATGKKD
ncbi:MAG: sigma-70 family RNA polymerase sigma factor [Clostridia bacterium]|nr:sigma-70 family RNA polymerase sigma factor [Clostridia bacterium]